MIVGKGAGVFSNLLELFPFGPVRFRVSGNNARARRTILRHVSDTILSDNSQPSMGDRGSGA